MHAELRFDPVGKARGGELVLPPGYLHNVQAMLYSAIERADPEWCHTLHNEGWEVEGKTLKMFAIGRFSGPDGSPPKTSDRTDVPDGSVVCRSPVSLVVSSPFERTLRAVVKGYRGSSVVGIIVLN